MLAKTQTKTYYLLMTTVLNRGKNTKIYLTDEERSESLVRYLNKAASDHRSQRRIRKLLARIQEFVEAVEKASNPSKSKEIADAHASLNDLLKRYKSAPYIGVRPPNRRKDDGSLFEPGERCYFTFVLAVGVRTEGAKEEALAVDAMLRLGKDMVMRIARCDCGNYFFRKLHKRKRPQRFCSADCRIQFWDNSEERKRTTRERAREYYWLHKNWLQKKKNVK
jgi:hypothetical protein